MSSCTNCGQNDCACCEGLSASTPLSLSNRAGLDSIAYRIGTHSRFRASMQARLSSSDYPALAALQSRASDDFTIGILDAWAMAADVLTFYQERIVNESYLRTATQTLSIRELAKLLGYRPAPGVAASVDLAFTLDSALALPASLPIQSTLQPDVQPVSLEQGLRVQSIPGQDESAQIFETSEDITARVEWNVLRPQLQQQQALAVGATGLTLDGLNTRLQRGSMIIIVDQAKLDDIDAGNWTLRRVGELVTDTNAETTWIGWKQPLASAFAAGDFSVFVLRQKAGIFGSNAMDWNALITDLQNAYVSGGSALNQWPDFHIDSASGAVDLDRRYEEAVPGGYVVLTNSEHTGLFELDDVAETGRAQYMISAQVTRLSLQGSGLADFEDNPTAAGVVPLIRATAVYLASEELTPALIDRDDVVTGTEVLLNAAITEMEAGRSLIFTGELEDGSGWDAETVTVSSMTEVNGLSQLTLSPGLDKEFARQALIIYGNVAAATHGETVSEVLGSGDARQVFQSFTLRQTPLTYVTADTASGSQTSLEVYVNDVQWEEVDYLYEREATERVYVTEVDRNGNTVLRFGDGVNGARLPTGQDNVRVIYRKGIGLDAMVRKAQISLLLSRPLGLKEVINPAPASGAADADTLAQARENAPLSALTLDRAVSLQDYEDFSRAFAGIAKAQASWIWNGRHREILITVAGEDGEELDESGATISNLISALKSSGASFVKFSVRNYQQAWFRIGARIKVAEDYLEEVVLEAAQSALREAYAFDNRSFGQSVALSEVYAVLHEVEGVEAVDINNLYLDGESDEVNARLDPPQPEPDADGEMQGAYLLLLDEGEFDMWEAM